MIEVIRESRALPVVTCVGPAEERGAQHGEALRDQIAMGLGAWSATIGERHGMDPDTYIRQFVQGTSYLDSIRKWTPDLEPEIAGISKGANQPWEWIYAYNLLDEEWTWARQFTAPGRGCTAVGLTPEGGAPLLAQTMDIPRVHDGTQAVLRVSYETGHEVNVFTYAGLIALTGCNSAGLALVVNNLDMLPGSLSGLPVACVSRGILQRETLQAAKDFAVQVPHATGQHYGMAAPDGVASVEGWANGVAAGMDAAALRHTNHPLYTDEPVGDVEARYQWSQTRERLAFINGAAGTCQDVPGLQQMLADRTVPISVEDNRGGMTFGAVIYECTVPPQMWVTPGPPHQYAFHHVSQERTPAVV